jgi:hypothetical protein
MYFSVNFGCCRELNNQLWPDGQVESLRAELAALAAEKAGLVERLATADGALVRHPHQRDAFWLRSSLPIS